MSFFFFFKALFWPLYDVSDANCFFLYPVQPDLLEVSAPADGAECVFGNALDLTLVWLEFTWGNAMDLHDILVSHFLQMSKLLWSVFGLWGR